MIEMSLVPVIAVLYLIGLFSCVGLAVAINELVASIKSRGYQ